MKHKLGKTRNSNLELLRVIAMLLIIAHHWSSHGFARWELPYGREKMAIEMLYMGGKVGVDVFVLISAYFTCKNACSLKKMLVFIGQVTFYSMGIFLLFRFFLAPTAEYRKAAYVMSLFPLLWGKYWFATDYLLLMILSPYLNSLIQALEEKQYRVMLFAMTIIWCLLPTMFIAKQEYVINLGYSEFVWFCYLYLLAGYIEKYASRFSGKAGCYFAITGIACLGLIGTVWLLSYVRENFAIERLGENTIFARENSLFTLIVAVFAFLGFLSLKPTYIKWINLLGGATFGVYLIHDNEYMRPYLWKNLFHTTEQFEGGAGHLVVHAILCVTVIFAIGTLIDIIRKYSVEKLWIWTIDQGMNKIPKWTRLK